ncbi:hypothetical protein N505_0105420 [Rhodococcus aetherivorans]|nr:hypothetical protein N505_0105420 [Rhodococcus aetherivorans]
MTEMWRPVVGFEGAYEVSNEGQVRSIDRHVAGRAGSTRLIRGRALKPGTAKRGGYHYVILSGRTRYVHHLVLEAFIGPRPEGDTHTRHLNGNPQDNRVENLQWGTRSENFLDTVEHGMHNNASKTHCKWGHEFTPENTIPNSGGRNRACRTCARNRGAEWARRKRRQRGSIRD